MNWERVERAWRKAADYLKSKFARDPSDSDEPSLLDKTWPSDGHRPGFPAVPQPAFAPIPK